MARVSFSVDEMLRICAPSEELAIQLGKGQDEIEGMPCGELLRLVGGGLADEVSSVVESGEARFIKGSKIPCLCGGWFADVSILPRRDGGSARGANISVEFYRDGATSGERDESGGITDSGKNLVALVHSMKNPLNTLKGAVFHLERRYAHDESILMFAKIAGQEISRLNNLVTQLLGGSTFIRPSDKIETEVNTFLQQIEGLISLQAIASNVECVFEYGSGIPLAEIGPERLREAVLNVVNNALEAMPGGGGLRVKTARRLSPAADFVVIEISDTGLGMPGAVTAGVPLSTEKAGRGFGLSITEEIMRQHGGRLEIMKGQERGTSVVLCFKAVKAAVEERV
jgi:signal transduction histidine kinase